MTSCATLMAHSLVNEANPMISRANLSPGLMGALLVRRHGHGKLDA
jgi:hypothetical protein